MSNDPVSRTFEPLVRLTMINQANQMVDSAVESIRVYWREKLFNAPHDEACDPRPFFEVWKERSENV